jgi:hypothetical protein
MTRWLGMTAVVVTLGGTLLATGCEQRPGYNAYGRYQGTNANSSDAVYDRLKGSQDDDWYKDRPM